MSIPKADLAISATWIIPVVPTGRTLDNCSLIVNDGRILDIVPTAELHDRYTPTETITLEGHALMPGLINCHGHAAMSLFRGYADDKPLMTWLEDHIWPAEARWVDEQFVYDGTQLAIGEMLLSGTTCYSDMYFFPEASAQAAHDSGIRAQIAFPVLDFPTAWASNADEYLHKGLALHDKYRSHDRVNIAFGPHAPYTVSDEPLRKIATYAEELQAPIQIHLHETAFEVESAETESSMRPIQRMDSLGLLSPLTQCVHMTQLNDDDIGLLTKTGAHVIHCPDSNLKLASGLSPITKLIKSGVNVALGTDGAASNNDLNLLTEAKQAALLAKYQSNDAAAIDAYKAIELATLAGARALGIDDITGSLETGKSADICAIDLNHLKHQPVYNAASQIIYSDAGNSVSHVWVNGKTLVKNGALTTLSEQTLIAKAHDWKEKINHG